MGHGFTAAQVRLYVNRRGGNRRCSEDAQRGLQRGFIKEGMGAARPLRNCIVVGYAPFSP